MAVPNTSDDLAGFAARCRVARDPISTNEPRRTLFQPGGTVFVPESGKGRRVQAGPPIVAAAPATVTNEPNLTSPQAVAVSAPLGLEERFRMANAIWRSLAASQLELHFQPIINIHNRAVVAVEALLRLRGYRAAWGATLALALAEEADQIGTLASWVAGRACEAATLWARNGVVTYMNVSPQQLAQGDLVNDVAAALGSANLRPSDLAVEITEASLIHSLFGCLFYGALVTKVLFVRGRWAPNWALPMEGGVLFTALTAVWFTSSFWFFTNVEFPGF